MDSISYSLHKKFNKNLLSNVYIYLVLKYLHNIFNTYWSITRNVKVFKDTVKKLLYRVKIWSIQKLRKDNLKSQLRHTYIILIYYIIYNLKLWTLCQYARVTQSASLLYNTQQEECININFQWKYVCTYIHIND